MSARQSVARSLKRDWAVLLILTLAVLAVVSLVVMACAALAEAKPYLSLPRAEKAVKAHEGKGTRLPGLFGPLHSEPCKRHSSLTIVCYFTTPASNVGIITEDPGAVWTGFDRVSLKGRRLVVTSYGTQAVECPNACEVEPPMMGSGNTFAADTARSAWEATHNQISTASGPTFEQSQELAFRAEQAAKEAAWVAAVEARKQKPPPPLPPVSISVNGVVTCTQSPALDQAEAQEAYEARATVIELHKTQATERLEVELSQDRAAEQLEVQQMEVEAGYIESPPPPAIKEQYVKLAAERDTARIEAEAKIAAVQTRATQELAEAHVTAETQEQSRIAKHENGCEPHFPKVATVPSSAATFWRLEPDHFPPETKAVEEGKVTAIVVGEASGYSPVQSAPMQVVAR